MANIGYYEKKIDSLQTCQRVLTLAISELAFFPDGQEVDRLQRDLITRRDSVNKQLQAAQRILKLKAIQQTSTD